MILELDSRLSTISKKFPIDYVKIDGEFIINIDKDEKDRAFVNSIITLALTWATTPPVCRTPTYLTVLA